MHYIGKYTDRCKDGVLDDFNDVHLDMLWFIMNLTKIHRFITEDSFKELLVRYFLVRDKNIDDYALDVINDEILIDGYLNEQYFSFYIKDLVNLIGFASSSAKYNIDGSLSDFINNYKYKAPNINFSVNDDDSLIISPDALVYSFSGLTNLLHINKSSLKFVETINKNDLYKIEGANKLASYILNTFNDRVFEEFNFKNKDLYIDRLLKGDLVKFNVFKGIHLDNLASIYEIIVDKRTADEFRKDGLKFDCLEDLEWPNEHINIAYGIKNGYVKVSDHRFSLIELTDSRFDYNYDLLLGPDEELYSTKELFDNWQMHKWLHLISLEKYTMKPHACNAQHYDFIFSNRYGSAYQQLTLNNLNKIKSLINKNSKIIDFGAGTGRLTIPLAQDGYAITAVDASKEMLTVLTQKAKKLNLNIPIYEKLTSVEYKEERFDLIISLFTVLSYITSLDDLLFAMKNMWDLLNDDGIVILDLESIEAYKELSNKNAGVILTQQTPNFDDKVCMEFNDVDPTLCSYSEYVKGLNTDSNIDFDCKEEFQIRFWTIDDIIGIDHLFSVIDSFQVFNATYYILKKNR
jgi:SAM-dependent methyltransferase